jgi:hypothetical protein
VGVASGRSLESATARGHQREGLHIGGKDIRRDWLLLRLCPRARRGRVNASGEKRSSMSARLSSVAEGMTRLEVLQVRPGRLADMFHS